jgi:hypothetical protein
VNPLRQAVDDFLAIRRALATSWNATSTTMPTQMTRRSLDCSPHRALLNVLQPLHLK